MIAKDTRGFTLSELVVALAILVIVLTAALHLQQQGLSFYAIHAARIEAQQNGRLAVDRISRELRTATAITAIAASDLTFVDQNGVTTGYRLNATNLERTENGVTTILVGGVQSLTFGYSNTSGATTTDPTRVASIAIALATKAEDTTATSMWELHQQMIIQDRIRLRNSL